MSQLTPAQREIIRDVAEGKPVDPREGKPLVNMGLVEVVNCCAVLTPKGETVHAQIMQSGDGPESLKEMFRL